MRHLPNALSLLRLCSAPIVLLSILLNSQAALMVAFSLFIVGAISDLLDGPLARRLHAETALGTNLDPIADKALVLAALGGLGIGGHLSAMASVAVLAIGIRELLAGAVRLRLLSRVRDAPAGPWAKLKTLLQMIATGFLLGQAALTQISERVREMGSSAPDICLALAALIGILTLPAYIGLAKQDRSPCDPLRRGLWRGRARPHHSRPSERG